MDRHIDENHRGQYLGKDIKNGWMNHLVSHHYEDAIYRQKVPKKGTMLDVGSGCGKDVFHWLCQGYDVYGIDCCDWKLEFCKQKIKDFSFPDEWKKHFIFGYGEDLPFGNDTFDVVQAWMVLEHVQDWRKCIKEMIRVVKTGGIIYLNAPDYRNSYEEHYGIDIGKPIRDHKDELKKRLIEIHRSLDTFDGINFITKPEVMDNLKQYENTIKIMDCISGMVVRENGKLKYRSVIALVLKKIAA